MPINQWLGTAPAIAEVDTFTPTNPNTNDIYYILMSGFNGTSSQVSFTVVGTETPTAVVTGLTAAIAADTSGLFAGITVSGTTTLILTANTAGTAFKATAPTPFDGGGGSAPALARVATTANGGPNDWQDSNNWSLLNIPGENGASEETRLKDSSVDILYGLVNTSPSDPLLSLHQEQTYTGLIGHDENAGFEGDYLQIQTAKLFIGEDFDGSRSPGSSRVKIDVGDTVACEITGYNTSSTSDENKPACRLKANKSDHIIRDLRSGTYGLCFLDTETGEVGSIFQSFVSNAASDSRLTIGQGVTVATVESIGGRTTVKQAAGKTITTLTNEGGSMLTIGAGEITTLNTKGGTVTPASTGLITNFNGTGGDTDFTASAEPRTVTNFKVDSGATWQIDTSVVTLTNNIEAFESGRVQYRAS
jgi:hypothetical protein